MDGTDPPSLSFQLSLSLAAVHFQERLQLSITQNYRQLCFLHNFWRWMGAAKKSYDEKYNLENPNAECPLDKVLMDKALMEEVLM